MRRPGEAVGMRWARALLLPVTLVFVLASPVCAQYGPYVNLGWQTSLVGESAYTPGRPELILGWMRGQTDMGLEVGAAWTYLEEDEYRTFFLDERYAALYAPRDVVTQRDEFRSQYHVAEIGARLVLPLVGPEFSGLLGAETTQIMAGYRDTDGRERWERLDDTPWAITYGLRLIVMYGFVEWRGSWTPRQGDWSGWDSVHNHGITFGLSWNPLWE